MFVTGFVGSILEQFNGASCCFVCLFVVARSRSVNDDADGSDDDDGDDVVRRFDHVVSREA